MWKTFKVKSQPFSVFLFQNRAWFSNFVDSLTQEVSLIAKLNNIQKIKYLSFSEHIAESIFK